MGCQIENGDCSRCLIAGDCSLVLSQTDKFLLRLAHWRLFGIFNSQKPKIDRSQVVRGIAGARKHSDSTQNLRTTEELIDPRL